MRNNTNGFILVETLAVTVVVLSILVGIAVISVNNVIDNSKKEVCAANVLNLERMHDSHLVMNNRKHSDLVFTQYLQDSELLAENGQLSYIEGKFYCIVHSENDDDEIDEVPFL